MWNITNRKAWLCMVKICKKKNKKKKKMIVDLCGVWILISEANHQITNVFDKCPPPCIAWSIKMWRKQFFKCLPSIL